MLKLWAFVVSDINVGKQEVLSFEFKIMALFNYWQKSKKLEEVRVLNGLFG